MAARGKKPSGKKFRHNNVDYVGIFKNGTLKVRAQRTAPGNKIIRGIYTPTTNKWHNDELPAEVKKWYEANYS